MDIRLLHSQFCEYQVTIKNFRMTTIEAYRNSLQLFLRLLPHIREVEQVKPEDVQQFFYAGRTTRNWKPITFITYHKNLNVFFQWAIRQGCITVNPFADIEKPKLEKKLPTRLTKQEAMNLLESVRCIRWPSPFLKARNYSIFAMFLYCGLRKGELLNLKSQDVDLTNMIISIKQGKGNKDRVVPIPYPLRPILECYLDERRRLHKFSEYFFVSFVKDRGLSEDGYKHLVDLVKKKSGINFYTHMLRHTFATLMLEGGCDIYALSKMMGHNDIKTTTIYLSASVEHMRSEMGKHPLNF
jgi:site-specific recombinase XerD